MARPIKETPELFGEDAKRFESLIANPKPISQQEREKGRNAYLLMKRISNSQW